MTAEKHLDWIDVAKGIGIMLVVLGHTIVPQLRDEYYAARFLRTFIYSFHMPLFFFLSGYLFQYRIRRYTNTKQFILSKARKLLLPYLFFSTLAYVLIALALRIDKLAVILEDGGYFASSLIEAVWGILTYQGHVDKHIWFCSALFIVLMLNFLMPRLTKNIVTLILLFLLCISTQSVNYYGIFSYLAKNMFFFSLARVYFNHSKPGERIQKPHLAMLIPAFVMINLGYTYVFLNGAETGTGLSIILPAYGTVTAVLGIAAVCHLASALSDFRSAAKALSFLGTVSYDIYLMHAPFLVSGLVGILLYYSTLPKPLICAIVFVLGITLPALASTLIIRRVPLLNTIILGEKLKKS